MLSEYFRALLLIFLAEMGDKTQILSMVFATKYSVKKVLLGVFIGSLLNHGIAVALGSYMSEFIPVQALQIVAGALFILFGIMALRIEKEDDDLEEGKLQKFGPVLTVAMAFFIGELGDKTQITAITLSVDANYPAFILLGTVSGMIATSALGIFVGTKIGNKISEFTLKLLSGGIFIFFGVLKLSTSVPKVYLTPTNVGLFITILSIVLVILIRKMIIFEKSHHKTETLYRQVAENLYHHMNLISESVKDMCLGCSVCQGQKCFVGYANHLIELAIDSNEMVGNSQENKNKTYQLKSFDERKTIESLSVTLNCLKEFNQKYGKDFVVNDVREILETILFQKKVPYHGDIEAYIKAIEKEDKEIARELKQFLRDL